MAYFHQVERSGLGSMGLTIPIPGVQIPGAGDPCDPRSINFDANLCSQEISSALPSSTTMLIIGAVVLYLLLRR